MVGVIRESPLHLGLGTNSLAVAFAKTEFVMTLYHPLEPEELEPEEPKQGSSISLRSA